MSKRFWKNHGSYEHSAAEIAEAKKKKGRQSKGGSQKGKSDDKSIKSSKSSKSSKSTKSERSSGSSNMKSLGKAFSTIGQQLAALTEEDSDLSESDEEHSHFTFGAEIAGVCGCQCEPHLTMAHTIQKKLNDRFSFANN